MTLNHIHIGSRNLELSKNFYGSFFNFKKKSDHGLGVFLENDKGFLIAIDPVDKLPDFPNWFHFGFCLESKEAVKKIYDKMNSSGVKFGKAYQEFGSDAVAFYVFDPDGYKIEVSWHKD